MQNAFCDAKGHLAVLGYDITPLEAVVPSVGTLLQASRAASVPVVFTRSLLRPDYADGGIVVEELFPDVKRVGGVAEGSWDAEIIARLQPITGETVIAKTRYSAFFRTPL